LSERRRHSVTEPDSTPDERPWIDQGKAPPKPPLPEPNARRRPPGDDPMVMSPAEFLAHFGDDDDEAAPTDLAGDK